MRRSPHERGKSVNSVALDMHTVEFIATFGDERKKVELSQVFGNGGGYHLYVDRYYKGEFIPRQGAWYFTGESLSLDDIQILSAMLNPVE